MKLWCALGAVLGLVGMAGLASSANADDRIRTEIYNKDRVYNIYTSAGKATLIQFEQDESLVMSPASVLGIGDAEAWNLGVRGNHIVLKPVSKLPDTNLVVATNKRTYSFELLEAPKGGSPTYVLRFRYLDSESAAAQAAAVAEAKRAQLTAVAKATPVSINTDYLWRGHNTVLKPSAAYDDGQFTRLVYDRATELPVFYKVLPDGSEALLNYNVDPERRETIVLHEVIRVIRARLGTDVIEIRNRGYNAPRINESGTSMHGVVRVEKGAEQ